MIIKYKNMDFKIDGLCVTNDYEVEDVGIVYLHKDNQNIQFDLEAFWEWVDSDESLHQILVDAFIKEKGEF